MVLKEALLKAKSVFEVYNPGVVLIHDLLPGAMLIVYKSRRLFPVLVVPGVDVPDRYEREMIVDLDIQACSCLVLHRVHESRLAKLTVQQDVNLFGDF